MNRLGQDGCLADDRGDPELAKDSDVARVRDDAHARTDVEEELAQLADDEVIGVDAGQRDKHVAACRPRIFEHLALRAVAAERVDVVARRKILAVLPIGVHGDDIVAICPERLDDVIGARAASHDDDPHGKRLPAGLIPESR